MAIDKVAYVIKAVEQKTFPKDLFKYRSTDSSFTEKIITQNELWFSDPLLFNDPYDCNTPVVGPKTSSDEIKQWLLSRGVDPKYSDQLANKIKIDPDYMDKKTKEAMSRLGVCCFSSLYDSILQWSHYSDFHKGICLRFDIVEDPAFFVTPIIVSYRKLMKHYNHFIHGDKIVEYLIQPKYDDWSYESEIRIVKTKEEVQNNIATTNERAFRYKDSALREIIFGLKTPDSVIQKYKDLCSKNNKVHVQFSKMILGSNHHYQLLKVPI